MSLGMTGASWDDVEREMRRERKSAALAYVLWFFAGGVGAHRFYLGRIGSGAAMAALVLAGLPLVLYGIGLPMLLAWVAWQLFDLFYIPVMARKHLEARKPYVARRLGIDPGMIPA